VTFPPQNEDHVLKLEPSKTCHFFDNQNAGSQYGLHAIFSSRGFLAQRSIPSLPSLPVMKPGAMFINTTRGSVVDEAGRWRPP